MTHVDKFENEVRHESHRLRPRAGDGLYEATYGGWLKDHPEYGIRVPWGSDKLLFLRDGHLPVMNERQARHAAALFDHATRTIDWNKKLPPADKTLGLGDLKADLEALKKWLRSPGTHGIGIPMTFSHHGEYMRRYAVGGVMQAPSFCPISPDVIRFTSYPLRDLPRPPQWFRMVPEETYVEALHRAVLSVFEEGEIVDQWNGGQSFKLKTKGLHPKMYQAFNGHPRAYRAPAPPVGNAKVRAR